MNKNGGEWDFDMLANGDFDTEMLLDTGFQEWELSIGDAEDLDYSILDDEETDNSVNEMSDGVKRAIQIEFDVDDYEPAYELLKFFREQKANIGRIILDHLKAEKEKI